MVGMDTASAITAIVSASISADETDEQKMRRVLWRESDDYKRIMRWRVPVTAYCSIVLIAGGVSLLIYGDKFGPTIQGPKFGFAALLFFLVCVGPAYVFALARNASRRNFMDRAQVGLVTQLQDEEKQLVLDSNGKPDFASLWAVTQKRIDLYHSIATEQAEKSFRTGRRATVGGFIAVLVLGGFAAFGRGGTAAIAASVVGVAGAAMTGYIGATFMKSQSEASAQLSQFFLQPVEFSRMLGVERLLDTLQPSERARAIQRIVDSTMPAAILTPVEKAPEQKPAKKTLWQRLRGST